MEFNGFNISLEDTSILVEDNGFSVSVNPLSTDLDPDIVLATCEKDFCLNEEVLQQVQGDKTVFVVPDSVSVDLRDVESLLPGDKIDIYGVRIEAVKGDGLGYRFSMGNTAYLVAEKNSSRKDLKNLERAVDVAFLPFGANGMNMDEAVQAAVWVKPEVVIPFRSEDAPVRELKAKLEDRSIECRLRKN